MTTTARPISYATLADAKRDGSLVSWLAEMTPAQRVEAAQVCAANSRRTVSEWLATFGELIEQAELALEARAAGYDAAAALAEGRAADEALARQLVGELNEMQALGQLDGSPDLLRRYDAKSAHVRALGFEIGPDGAGALCLWRADNSGPLDTLAPCRVCGSDGGPCAEWPLTSPIPAGADIEQSIERRAIFDALCEAVDELRDYWRDVPKRLEMINAVWERMILAETFYFDARGNLLVESSTPGKWYAVGHTCPCDAGRWGNYCRHSVQGDILGRARLIDRIKLAA